jgi:hypothetical protein
MPAATNTAEFQHRGQLVRRLLASDAVTSIYQSKSLPLHKIATLELAGSAVGTQIFPMAFACLRVEIQSVSMPWSSNSKP